MKPKLISRKLVQSVATRLMQEKGITREQALRLIWNDFILICKLVDQNYKNLTEKQKRLEAGGRFDAFLKGEYDPYNG